MNKGGKNKNGTVASSEIVLIHLKLYLMTSFSVLRITVS